MNNVTYICTCPSDPLNPMRITDPDRALYFKKEGYFVQVEHKPWSDKPAILTTWS